MRTPWNSIAESIVEPAAPGAVSYTQAVQSPCLDCQTAPCCTHLPLNTFKVTNLVELDHALYLLNFDRIELGISASGDWSSYYVYPCRLWDRETHQCTVHNTPAQPRICQHYNPYNCWYRRVFTAGQGPDFVRIDYARMQALLPQIELNADRQITAVPAWDALQALMAAFDDVPRPFVEPDLHDEPFARWEQSVLNPDAQSAAGTSTQAYSALADPCDGCAAYCCKTLVFPQQPPRHVSNLDYYRFALGFPGVELGISDGGWSLIVRTRCRFLDERSRCSIFGRPERPLLCKYYDAWKCDYKPQFGSPRPANFMRIQLEQFVWLAESIPLDDNGGVLGIPALELLRQGIEYRWRELRQKG